MGKKGVLLAFVIFVSFLLSESAALGVFSVDSLAVKDVIKENEQAEFEITISNRAAFSDTFRIQAPEIFWSVQSRPLYHYFGGVEVDPLSSQKFTLLLNPIEPLPSGPYKVELDIDSINTGVTEKVFLLVYIRSSSRSLKEYLPAVLTRVSVPSRIDPREPVQVQVDLVNRNPRDIKELVISGNGLMSSRVVTSLEPLGRKSFNHTVRLDPLTSPQKAVAVWSLVADGSELEPVKSAFEVVSYSDVVVSLSPRSLSPFSHVDEIFYTNKGNAPVFKTAEMKTGFFSRLFTKTEPKAYVTSKPDGLYYYWDMDIQPQQSVSVKRVVDYTLVLLLFLGVAALFVLYFVFRSPVHVRKEVAVIGFEEGGISDIKVIIHIRNRAAREFSKVSISDRVPAIAHIAKDSEVGTLKASKIVQSREGTVIRWELDKLEKHEEWVVSYTIKSKLSILGRFSLPAATARFFDGSSERKTSSNSVSVRI